MTTDRQREQIRADMVEVIQEARRKSRRSVWLWLASAAALAIGLAYLPTGILK